MADKALPSDGEEQPRQTESKKTATGESSELAQPGATQSLVPRDQRIADILDEYVSAGDDVSRDKLLRQYPDLADELSPYLDGLEMLMPVVASTTTPESLGDYRLKSELGRGGMGVVYEAEQISLRRPVALKVLRYAITSVDSKERFQREAETVAGLNHSNIVPIYANGSTDEVHYFAMQLVDGQSLADVVANKQLSEAMSIAGWGEQAAEALDYAHQQGVVHRDVKPSNLLLDSDGKIWLTDFGLAKRFDDERLSMTGAMLGTPNYMSPEQASAQRRKIDHRTDVYSLGATLYELVTGSPVFKANSPHAVLSQILSADPIPPSKLRPGMPIDLETILLKCLEKHPEDRYATAGDLANDLRAFVDGRPIKARRRSTWERLRRWALENHETTRTAAFASALVATLLLGGIALQSYYRDANNGQVRFTSKNRMMIADVTTSDGERVLPTFTIPTQQPVTLPSGDYKLRLRGEGLIGATQQFQVHPGQTDERPVQLPELHVFPNRFVDGNVQTTHFHDGDDILVFNPARSYADRGITRIDGSTGQDIWKVKLDERLNEHQTTTRHISWSYLTNISETKNVHVVSPSHDLNADGEQDIVLCPDSHVTMVALDGASGKRLWSRVSTHQEDPDIPSTERRGDFRTVGVPVAVDDVDDDDVVDFAGLFVSPEAKWVEVISGKTGERISLTAVSSDWFSISAKQILPLAMDAVRDPDPMYGGFHGHNHRAAIPANTVGLNPYPMQLIRWGSVSCIALVAGDHVCLIDPSNGEHVLPPLDIKALPVRSPQFLDIDADGYPELLICEQRVHAFEPMNGNPGSKGALRVYAWSLKAQQELWRYDAEADWEFSGYQPAWPLMHDLDADGTAEILLADGNEFDTNNLGSQLQVLDARSGKPKWDKRVRGTLHSNPSQFDNFCVGPDSDGDGVKDVYSVSFFHDKPDSESLYIDVFSGKDGRLLWNREQLLLDFRNNRAQQIAYVGMWGDSSGGSPMLLVQVHGEYNGDVYLFSSANGDLLQSALSMRDMRLVDLNGDHALDVIGKIPAQTQQGAQLATIKNQQTDAWRRVGIELKRVLDIDGDGSADLVSVDRTSPQKPPLNAISGRTGLAIWDASITAQFVQPIHTEFCDETLFVSEGFGRRNALVMPWDGRVATELAIEDFRPIHAQSVDLDLDKAFEIVLLGVTPRMARPRRRRLSVVGAKDGRERFHVDLGPGNRIPAAAQFAELAFADFDQDGVRDIVAFATADPQVKQSPIGSVNSSIGKVTVANGSDGNTLWQVPLSEHTSDKVPSMLVCDPDHDQLPNVAVFSFNQSRTRGRLQLVDDQGEVRSTWEQEFDSMNRFHPTKTGYGQSKLFVIRRNGFREVAFSYVHAVANHPAEIRLVTFDFSKLEATTRREHVIQTSADWETLHTSRLIAFDMDDDGTDEVLCQDGRCVKAVDIDTGETRWQFQVREDEGEIYLHKLVRESQSLNQFAPLEIWGWSNEGGKANVFGLNAATGEQLWASILSEPLEPSRSRACLDVAPEDYPSSYSGSPLAPQRRLICAQGDSVFTQMATATSPTSGAVVHVEKTRSYSPALDDRLKRDLPWVDWSRARQRMVDFLIGMILSAAIVGFPFLFLRHNLSNGKWSLRALLLLPVVLAIPLAALQYAPPPLRPGVYRMGANLMTAIHYQMHWGFIAALIWSIWQGEFKRTVMLCGLLLAITLAATGMLLWADTTIVGTRYAWTGWYWIFWVTVPTTGLLVLVYQSLCWIKRLVAPSTGRNRDYIQSQLEIHG